MIKPNKQEAAITWVTPVAKKEMLQETNEASDNAITTQRRSYLSASQPEGYCEMAPPKT